MHIIEQVLGIKFPTDAQHTKHKISNKMSIGVWLQITHHGVTQDDVQRASMYVELYSKRKEMNGLYWFGPSYRVIVFTSSQRVAFYIELIDMIVRVQRGAPYLSLYRG